ncbi:DUF2169 family type VI secretion system accessory protein [Paraliomyxa miuraensis]|uniref:DUF2169 family type VI secretion system accessory protein n=1 Tax=Paraliomyxa miuraensis TaxID=376150 RepID=UPI00224E7BC6|nr:DUF2169 domain-containing protein [Paraliomyxa miuraensis]MCX4240172.1 DUF2169 domain-containing protein [Paraliomyxa miuraensis]
MFVVDNRTSYAAERASFTDGRGAVLWVVVVKGTYDVAADGSTSLAAEQIAPVVAPVHHGDPARSSLLYETDLVPPKPATDVLVCGFGHAPGGRPSVEFTIGLELAGLRKVLTVRGDRRFERFLGAVVRPGPTTPVVRVPLVYERAYGGHDDRDPDPARQRLDPRNPVGCGVAARAEHLVGSPAANFEYPGADLARAGPAGLGPIASHWKPRSDYAGTYDAAWVRSRKPLLPEDFDERYFNCAPADQQLRAGLPRDARLLLLNLSPRGTLSIAVPHVHLRYTTFFTKAARQRHLHHRGKLNTILAEPELDRLTLVWSTVLDCGRDVDHIEATRIIEKEAIV